MFNDQSDATPEGDFSESPLTPQSKRLHVQPRTVINVATLLVVLSVFAAAAPWWVNAVGGWREQLFPPPPYTGSLLFEDSGVTLTARAITDGRVIWRLASIQPNSTFFRDGPDLYIIPAGQHQMIAIRVSDGHQLWKQAIPIANISTFVGSDLGQIYVTTRIPDEENSNLVAFDKQTGKPANTVSTITSALLDTSAHFLIYCQDLGETHRVISMNLATKQQLWQQALPGFNCHVALQNNLIIDDAVIPSQHVVRFVAFNRQTGAHLWQADAAGEAIHVSPTTLIVETNLKGDPSILDNFTAIDVATGKQLWSQTQEGINTPVFSLSSPTAGGTIVLSTTSMAMLVDTDDRTGATRWTLPTSTQADDPQSWYASMDMTTLYFADRSQLQALDLMTGKPRWQLTGLDGVPTSLVIQGQFLYETAGNQLVARDASTGRVRWQHAISTSTQLCAGCDDATGS